ncbi:Ferredoxin [Photobacterium sp. SKA34]|nr:Ferredoxin [Photobacterium sp. SKA34]
MYQVRLLPNNITFTASAQQTVLQAALDAGITFPNRCQVGACAMCMCRKTSGEVSYQ